MIHKHAGILNPPKDRLSPQVWKADNNLRDIVREQILNDVREIHENFEEVKAIIVLGSITGFKWTDTSDVDVMIAIDPFDPSVGKTKKTKAVNGRVIPTTKHPINYFITAYHSDLRSNLKNHDWGVYDVLNKFWIASPGDPSLTRSPKNEFHFEIEFAKQQAREFERRAKFYEEMKAKSELKPLPNSLLSEAHFQSFSNSLKQAKQALLDLADKLDSKRKEDYSSSFGIARIGIDNIVFKYIEHGPYAELFEQLKEENSKRKMKDVEKEKTDRATP